MVVKAPNFKAVCADISNESEDSLDCCEICCCWECCCCPSDDCCCWCNCCWCCCDCCCWCWCCCWWGFDAAASCKKLVFSYKWEVGDLALSNCWCWLNLIPLFTEGSADFGLWFFWSTNKCRLVAPKLFLNEFCLGLGWCNVWCCWDWDWPLLSKFKFSKSPYKSCWEYAW